MLFRSGRQRPERRQCAIAGTLESAQRSLQCVRGRLRDRRLYRHPRTENQTAPFGHLSVRKVIHIRIDFFYKLHQPVWISPYAVFLLSPEAHRLGPFLPRPEDFDVSGICPLPA